MKLKLSLLIFTIFILLFSTSTVFALTVDEIMDKMEETAPDFTTQKTISEMILIDKNGKEETREMITNQGESPVLRRVMNLWERAFLMKI